MTGQSNLDSLRDFTRRTRSRLVDATDGDVTAARGAFFSRLTREALSECLDPGGEVLSSAQIAECLGLSIPLTATGEEFDVAFSDRKRERLHDPLAIGWAYQIWNERERDENSWGVSKRELRQAERVEVGLVTQLFTDEYIANFMVRRCRALVSRGSRGDVDTAPSVCDPACGVGHILIEALRVFAEDDDDRARGGCRVFGFDIDPEAVELCRVLLLIEWLRLGNRSGSAAFWEHLQGAIAVVDAPFGTLLRTNLTLRGLFDVVVTNPPYLGRRKLSAELRAFLDSEYPAASVDLCAAFMQRCVELTRDGGATAFVTSDKWLRLKGYESLRNGQGDFAGLLSSLTFDSVCELGARAFHPRVSMHDGVRVALLCARKGAPEGAHSFSYLNVVDSESYQARVEALRDFSLDVEEKGTVKKLPQHSLALDAGSAFLRASEVPAALLDAADTVELRAQVVVGTQTNDDSRFVRYIWQVLPDPSRWRVHNKGGGYDRWCGLNRWVIDWGEGARSFFKGDRARELAEAWVARPGWTYTWFANGALGLRVKEAGWSFGRAAASGVFVEDTRLIAFLNSRFASVCARSIGGKIQLPEGVVRRLPIPDSLEAVSDELVRMAVEVKRRLVAQDPSDALWDPTIDCAPFERVVLESLLLLVEGALEAQVERALGVRHARSLELRELWGAPVAWYGIASQQTRDEFWACVPRAYLGARGVIEEELAALADPDEVDRSLRRERLRSALEGRVVAASGRWVLPTSCYIEGVCRAARASPIECVALSREWLEEGSGGRMLIEREWIFRRALVDVLRALDHRWWSRGDASRRERCEPRTARELSRVALEAVGGAIQAPIERWFAREFMPWQARVFHNASPIVSVNGEIEAECVLRHSWDAGGGTKENSLGSSPRVHV